jgi:hypothetical protein
MKPFAAFLFMALLTSTAISEELLKPGETWTYTAQYTVKDADICSDIVNNATVNALDPCFKAVGPARDNATVKIKYKADMALNKTSDKFGKKVNARDTINYTYYVTNTGDVNLAIESLIDDMVNPVQYTSGDENGDGLLNPEEVWIYEGAYKVEEDDLCFDIINIAVVKATDPCHSEISMEDREVVETNCIEKVCCQDRNNLEGIKSGEQVAIGLGYGKAENNVKIASNQRGLD